MCFTRFVSILLLATVANADGRSTIDTFSLPNHRGVEWTLPKANDAPIVVVAFLGTQCPLAKLYGPRLQQMQEEFAANGVVFVGVNSNTQDSPTEISAYVARHKIHFPMLKDKANTLADRFGAERTPEVFVLDAERQIRYQGRIDDQYLVGLTRDKPSSRELHQAISQLLAGKDVDTPKTEAIGCHIGRVTKTEPTGDVTWATHIAPIIYQHCTECHRTGEIAPFVLEDYDDVLGWEDTILEVIDDRRMPPWFADPKHGEFKNDARLTAQERSLISEWVENGMPKGDLSQLPPKPQFITGWRIPKPDQVIHFDEKPFSVPAEGVVDYQYFEVDPKWDEDKYVVATEARPDNVAVVHHIIAYVIEPKSSGRGRRRRMLVGYAPGSLPQDFTDGTAIHVKAGSKLLFEMHYTPSGTAQVDHSYIGLKFTDKKNVKRLLKGRAVANDEFTIPPHAENFVVTATRKVPGTVKLLSMTPHMHLRGKGFRYEAKYPDGTRETLLNVPNYDFNWQLSYRLKEPKILPKGTVLVGTATYNLSLIHI